MFQPEPSLYFSPEYNTKERFISYWHQISEIVSLKPESVLEVGIGNKFVYNYLKSRGINIKSLDIDVKLSPDYVGNCAAMPFNDRSFDVAACYEVLEHMPYEKLPCCLAELNRVSRCFVLLSLPDCSPSYPVYFKIPKTGIVIRKLFSLPGNKARKFEGEHCWEIGAKGYEFKNIEKAIDSAGLKLVKSYRIFENPYHRIFVLKHP